MNHPAINAACGDPFARSVPAATAIARRSWGWRLWALFFDSAARPGKPERLDALDAHGLRDIGWWCVARRRAEHANLASHRIDFFL